jgi:hypothetical protein
MKEETQGIEAVKVELHHLKSLRGINVLAALVHASVIFFLVMVNIQDQVDVQFFNSSILENNLVKLFSVDLSLIVVIYLAIAATFHVLVSTVFFKTYSTFIKQHRNPFRWIEYSISCSLMLVALSLSTGITLFSTLVAIFFTTFGMNFCGLLFEHVNRRLRKNYWPPFVLGTILGAVPWVLMFLTISLYTAEPASFFAEPFIAYGVVLGLFALFPLNLILSAKKIGPWKSYVTTEIGFIALSYLAKTTLAVMIYFGIVAV